MAQKRIHRKIPNPTEIFYLNTVTALVFCETRGEKEREGKSKGYADRFVVFGQNLLTMP